MNILDLFRIGKLALNDKAQIESLVSSAKTIEGPKPSWKTGEFWINQVVPTAAIIFGGLSGFIPATWFVGGLLVIAGIGYLGRTALKMFHAYHAGGIAAILNAQTLAEIQTNVTTIGTAISALKDGNLDAAKQSTETLNAPVTVNVNK